MRIIAGAFRGRVLADPRGNRTHPMSEKIRGALFNALGDIEGLTVLDAFTGTGSVAIEAVSRGAVHVMAIDNDVDAFKCASGNVVSLKLQEVITVLCTNAKTWSNNNQGRHYDVVIADPPFNEVNDTILEKIGRHVKPGSVYVLSLPADYSPRQNNDFTLIDAKSYGDAKLAFYRKIS